jgi:hypothetical protein
MVFSNEIMSQDYYTYLVALINVMFPIAGILISVMFYLFRNWFVIHFIMIGIMILALIVFYFINIETPQFLLANHKDVDFVNTIKYVSQINGTEKETEKELQAFESKFYIKN